MSYAFGDSGTQRCSSSHCCRRGVHTCCCSSGSGEPCAACGDAVAYTGRRVAAGRHPTELPAKIEREASLGADQSTQCHTTQQGRHGAPCHMRSRHRRSLLPPPQRFGTDCWLRASPPAAPRSDPGPLRHEQQRPDQATPVAQSEPKKPRQDERLDADAGSVRGAALRSAHTYQTRRPGRRALASGLKGASAISCRVLDNTECHRLPVPKRNMTDLYRGTAALAETATCHTGY